MHILKHFHRRKLENCREKRNYTNSLLSWQRSSEGKQQYKYDCENVTNLPGEFLEHKLQGGNWASLSTLVQYSYALYRNHGEPPSGSHLKVALAVMMKYSLRMGQKSI